MKANYEMQFLQCPTSAYLHTWLKYVALATLTTAARVSNASYMSDMRECGHVSHDEKAKVEV